MFALKRGQIRLDVVDINLRCCMILIVVSIVGTVDDDQRTQLNYCRMLILKFFISLVEHFI